ncbi:MAG: hypothetical protein RIC38_08020 [Chromatocurvus sp.]
MKNHQLNDGVSGIRSMLLVLALGAGLTLVGCEQQGPAEQAGENIDDAAEAAGDKLQDAADEMEDATDRG